MRTGLLGLVALCCCELPMVQAQSGFQEPLPIPAGRMQVSGPASSIAPRFPTYAPWSPTIVPAPAGVYAPYGYLQAPTWQPGFAPQMQSPSAAMMAGAGHIPYPQPILPVAAQSPVTSPSPDATDAAPEQPERSQVPPEATEGSGEPYDPGFAPPPSLPEGTPVSEESGPDAPPAEPDEPYMVKTDSGWKPVRGQKLYGSAEYLFWLVKAQPLTGNLSLSISTPNQVPQLHSDGLNGARFTVGAWLNPTHDVALEGNYLFLHQKNDKTAQTFPPVQIVVKPIFDGVVTESANVSSASSFQGAELNVRHQACTFDWSTHDCPGLRGRLDFLGGFRFADLSENLSIGGTTIFGTAPVLLADTTITTTDVFGTHNHLFAGQFGFDGSLGWGRVNVTGYAKLALGDNRQNVNIDGTSHVSGPPVLGTFDATGGFFAQPSNTGRFRHDVFSMMPETGLNFSYQLGDHCRLSLGYTLLYFTNVVRPGQQIDTANANAAARPALFFLGGTRPEPVFDKFIETTFWAQGINLAVEVTY